MMARVVQLWTNFWFAEISPYPIALFRLLFGFYLLIYFLGALPNVPLFYSNEGVYSPVLIPDIAPAPAIAWLLYLMTVLLIIGLIAGYRMRIVAPLLLLFYSYHFCLNIWVRACSYDRLIYMSLIILCLAPSDHVLSVRFGRSKSNMEWQVTAWATRLLAVHLCLFYLSTALYKLLSPGWHGGEIIKGVMSSVFSSEAAFFFVGLKLPGILFDIMACLVIVFELICPIGFLIRDLEVQLSFLDKPVQLRNVQYYFFVAGILFHTGIWIFMQIPQFMICPIFYVLFMPAADIQRLLAWATASWDRRLIKKEAAPGIAGYQPALTNQLFE
jgi:hypothetical protein